MTYLLIESGVVVQKQPNPQDGFIAASDGVVCGMLYNAETGEFTAPEPVPQPVTLDVLSVDTWQIDADSTAEAVATYTSSDTVNFVVDGVVVPVEPVDSVATLMISADAPGAIPVQVRAQQFVIIAVEVTP